MRIATSKYYLCPHCNEELLYEDPQLYKEGKNLYSCPKCGADNNLRTGFILQDKINKYLISYKRERNSLFNVLIPGYQYRSVSSYGKMQEKMRIFDDGYNDIAIELLKVQIQIDSGQKAIYDYNSTRDDFIVMGTTKMGKYIRVEMDCYKELEVLALKKPVPKIPLYPVIDEEYIRNVYHMNTDRCSCDEEYFD